MSLSWYLCKKCATALKKDSSPSSSSCPEGHYHEWTNVGAVGDTNYQCKKCATLVDTNSSPNHSNCPAGNYHDWKKL
jgi:DNA-directed RNA polymerase subunit RPC12/RpoP